MVNYPFKKKTLVFFRLSQVVGGSVRGARVLHVPRLVNSSALPRVRPVDSDAKAHLYLSVPS